MTTHIASLLSIALGLAVVAPAYADRATCADGTTTYATGRGACSRHGGVVDTSPTPRFPEGARAPVLCHDGSTSTVAGRGACSHHGGVVDDSAAVPNRTPERDRERTSDRDRERAAERADRERRDRERARRVEAERVDRDRRERVEQRERERAEQTAQTATARCRDGSLSYSEHHSGTCSGHGGVVSWLR